MQKPVRQGVVAEPPAGSSDLANGGVEGSRRDSVSIESLTQTHKVANPAATDSVEEAAKKKWPDHIGPYQVVSKLGQGAFGLVLLATDTRNGQSVAIKVPRPDRRVEQQQLDDYRLEAENLMRLEHPHIVRVLDVGSDSFFGFYIVSQFIDGMTLEEYLRGSKFPLKGFVELIHSLAEALQHAHERGMFHRDLKPPNILLDRQGQAYLADFGLALREEDRGSNNRGFGTPGYCSPEQANQEDHAVDGRSDLYSLGVILYECLLGRVPFPPRAKEDRPPNYSYALDYARRVCTLDPIPPRQKDRLIPAELERICLKALERRKNSRYRCAADMVDDLRALLEIWPSVEPFRASPATPDPADSTDVASRISTEQSDLSGETVLKIIPRGLRSFEASDAGFFLDLLPGPRDRDGLPDSLRFWKSRIESREASATFKVGVLYGPSGCGKSSLVKAGLLPRLAEQVLPVFVEASANDTERRLLRALQRACGLVSETDLSETLRALRHEPSRSSRTSKVLIVMDQFEQWLHANPDSARAELTSALRHCDGEHLQCLLLVRDDFWVALSRFLHELDIPLLEGTNSGLADLFDLPHARRVLGAYGAAFGAVPRHLPDWSAEQQQFVEQTVSGLAEDNKVISVRLALFAEMVKSKPWTPATLTAVGGTSGVGVTFLEETFAVRTAPMGNRAHLAAVRGVLKALLPSAVTDIKGHSATRDELLTASGYTHRPRDFDTLLHILDRDLRLITPVDSLECGDSSPLFLAAEPPSLECGDASPLSIAAQPLSLPNALAPSVENKTKAAPPQTKAVTSHRTPKYQLAHDYLVPSVRDWLTRKQKETWRGRASLRLEERTAQWLRQPQSRHLPSWFEFTSILCGVPRRQRTPDQRRVLRRATQHHLIRWGSLVLLILATSLGINRYLAEQQWIADDQTAITRINVLAKASPDAVSLAIEPLAAVRELAIPKLRALLSDTSTPKRDRIHAAYALANLGDTTSSDAIITTILDAVPTADVGEAKNMVVAFRELAAALDHQSQPYQPEGVSPRLNTNTERDNHDHRPGANTRRLIQSAALDRIFREIQKRALLLMNTDANVSAITPQRTEIAVADSDPVTCVPSEASETLTNTNIQEPDSITSLPAPAEEPIRPRFHPTFDTEDSITPLPAPENSGESNAQNPIPSDTNAWLKAIPVGARLPTKVRYAALALYLGDLSVASPMCALGPDPTERTAFTLQLKDWPADLSQVRELLMTTDDESLRSAVCAAVGRFPIPADVENDELVAVLKDLFVAAPDGGSHSAIDWTLRQWGVPLPSLTAGQFVPRPSGSGHGAIPKGPIPDGRGTATSVRRWYVNSVGMTFVEVPAGKYELGSELGYEPSDHEHELLRLLMRGKPSHVELTRTAYLSNREVTVAQFLEFINDSKTPTDQKPRDWRGHDQRVSTTNDCPMQQIDWFDSALYCNWLSRKEGWPPCYHRTGKKLKLKDYNNQEREVDEVMCDFSANGYRLPTAAEWEVACRAGTLTVWSSGKDEVELREFAVFNINSKDRTWSSGTKLPNGWGLFDVHGNVSEWCHDWFGDEAPSGRDPQGPVGVSDRVFRGGSWNHVPQRARSAFRHGNTPDRRDFDLGFRVLAVQSGPPVSTP